MLKKRKAQGLPITVIVVAVIALLVVVILVAVFSGRMGKFGQDIDALKQGSCVDACTALGMGPDYGKNVDTCTKRIIPGEFSEISGQIGGKNVVCCCKILPP